MTAKIYSIITFFSLLLGLFFISSCQKEVKSNEAFDLQKKLESFNAGKLEFEQGELLRGNIVISPLPEKRVGILIQDDSKKESLIYVLQMSTEPKFEIINLKDAQLLYIRTAVFINSVNTPENFLFSIDNNQALIKGISISKSFNGFGLSRSSNHQAFEINKLKNQEIYNYLVLKTECTCECYRTGGPTDCSAGGTGSTSCSKKSGTEYCSVSCSSGYYACCNCVTKGND